MLLDPEVSNQLLGFIGPLLTHYSHKAAFEIEQNIAISLAAAKQLLIDQAPEPEAA